MTLYEMTDTVRTLYELMEAGEIDEQTFADTVEAIGADDKLEGYCQVIKQLKAEAEMFAAEAARLTERKKAIEANAERMRGAVIAYMSAAGQTKAKAGTFSVSIGSTESVEILDSAAIPAEYMTQPAPTPSKTAIKDALKAGVDIAGARLAVGTRLTIR